ncbi:MAG: ABC transporter permease, partial [Acidobacteriota bacterium]
MRRLGFLVRKEFQELRRNPRMLRVLLIAPVFQLGILGYASTTDVKNVPAIVVDADRSTASRDLIGRFDGSPYFSVVGVTSRHEDVEDALQHRTAWMAIAIPAGYGRAVADGTPVTVQVIADGTDSNSAAVGLGYATSLIAEAGVDVMTARLVRSGQIPPVGRLESRTR